MKPVYILTIGEQSLHRDMEKVFLTAQTEHDSGVQLNFEINKADAVLFPVGTKISITIEALEA